MPEIPWRSVHCISPELLEEGKDLSPPSVSAEQGCSLPASANTSSGRTQVVTLPRCVPLCKLTSPF